MNLKLSGAPGLHRGLTEKRHKRNFWGNGNIVYFYYSSGYTIIFVKAHQTSLLQKMKFIVYKSYFAKSDFKKKSDCATTPSSYLKGRNSFLVHLE